MEKSPLLEKIEWQAPEYEFQEKSADWFWSIGIITVALFFSAIFLKNFLFGVIILLGGFSLAMYGARKPRKLSVKVSYKGIQIGNIIYEYENLKCFWINYDPPYNKELMLESKKSFMPHISIMLEDTDPENLRAFLLQYLKEQKIEEPLITTLARLLKI